MTLARADTLSLGRTISGVSSSDRRRHQPRRKWEPTTPPATSIHRRSRVSTFTAIHHQAERK